MSQPVPDLFLKIDTLAVYARDWPPGTDSALRARWKLNIDQAVWSRAKRGGRPVGDGLLGDIVAGAFRREASLAAGLAQGQEQLLRLPFARFWRLLDDAASAERKAAEIEDARERTRGVLRALLLGEGDEKLRGEAARAEDVRPPLSGERWVDASPYAGLGQALPAGGSFTLRLPAAMAGRHRLWLYELADAEWLDADGRPAGGEMVRWIDSPSAVDAEPTGEGPAIRLNKLSIGQEAGSFTLRAIVLPWAAEATFDEAGFHGARRKLDFAETALVALRLGEAVRRAQQQSEPDLPKLSHLDYHVRGSNDSGAVS